MVSWGCDWWWSPSPESSELVIVENSEPTLCNSKINTPEWIKDTGPRNCEVKWIKDPKDNDGGTSVFIRPKVITTEHHQDVTHPPNCNICLSLDRDVTTLSLHECSYRLYRCQNSNDWEKPQVNQGAANNKRCHLCVYCPYREQF